MSDFDAQQPVRAIATEFTTEVANAAGTTINPAEEFPQGSTTIGQSGPLSQAAVTAATPAYLDGTTAPLSLDTSGNLRVTIDSSTSEQNVNLNEVGGVAFTLGQNTMANSLPITIASNQTPLPVTQSTTPWVVDVTQWDNTPLGAPSNYGTSPGPVPVIGVNAFITNAPSITNITGTISLPTGAATSANQTTANTSLSTIISNQTNGTQHTIVDNFPADADAYAQGSLTAGQLGNLTMGAVTTAAPVYTTAQTNPLSLDLAGNLRVVGANVPNTTPAVLTYFADVAVATNATVTHSVAGPTNLDAVHGAGSGEIKMTIAIGVTGLEVVYWNGFTSASNQDCEFALKNTYVIPAGSSAKVTLLNRDKAAQDLYLTFVTH